MSVDGGTSPVLTVGPVSVQTSCSLGPNGTITADARLSAPTGWMVMFDADADDPDPTVARGVDDADGHPVLLITGGGSVLFTTTADVESVQLLGPAGQSMSIQVGSYIESSSTCRFYGVVIDS
jgi:hypothetical protein